LFYRDATSIGEDAKQVKHVMGRLGNLFRAIRFSDKPSGCAISTFTVNTRHPIVDMAVDYSLLIRAFPRRGKNNDIEEKYQINPMIAPRWDLPTARRGTCKFSVDELAIIFGKSDKKIEQKMTALEKQIVEKMMDPSFGKSDNNNPDNLFFFGG
jgi:hypothetical protein